jgi:hypothetical protein
LEKSVEVHLCVISDEMIVYKAYLGQSDASDSILGLLRIGELVPIDSWSSVGLKYEKYSTEDFQRCWNKIKSPHGLQDLSKVPTEGSWGILYEYR